MSKSTIPVTVVVTVLNEALTVERLLTGLAAQTYQPMQVILVDGGSTDNTATQVADFQQRHPQFPLQWLVHPGNRSQSRNFGIKKATTKVIAITDAGCVPLNNWLAELMTVVTEQAGHANVVVAGYYTANPATPFEEAVVPYVLVMPDRVNPNHFLPATRSMALTKSAWQAVGGFNERLADNEDYAFARSLAAHPEVKMFFTNRAKVVWQPRSTLPSFWWMIFRFARGDIQAGIVRPKVGFLIGRYAVGLVVLGWLLAKGEVSLAGNVVLIGLFFYSCWAMAKNGRYTPKGWYWLPLLQIAADTAVLSGSAVGLMKRLRDYVLE